MSWLCHCHVYWLWLCHFVSGNFSSSLLRTYLTSSSMVLPPDKVPSPPNKTGILWSCTNSLCLVSSLFHDSLVVLSPNTLYFFLARLLSRHPLILLHQEKCRTYLVDTNKYLLTKELYFGKWSERSENSFSKCPVMAFNTDSTTFPYRLL